MSSKLPYFRWHPKDFDTDENVRLMSMCEVGLYVLCLNHCWVNGSLPDDLRKIAKIVGQPFTQIKKSWPAVSKCFTKNESGGFINPKQEKERKWAQERRDKSKDAVELREEQRCNPNPQNTVLSRGEGLEKDDHPRAYDSDSDSDSDSLSQTTNFESTSTRAQGEFVDFETFLHRWRGHRGFKKPQKHLIERAQERWGKVKITEDGLAAALDGYYSSDWAKQQGYPILGFLKDPGSWIESAAEDSWEQDQGYMAFVDLYTATGGPYIPDDGRMGWEFWKSMEPAEKAKACVHVVTQQGAYIKKIQNYLKTKEFLRPERPQPKSELERMMGL